MKLCINRRQNILMYLAGGFFLGICNEASLVYACRQACAFPVTIAKMYTFAFSLLRYPLAAHSFYEKSLRFFVFCDDFGYHWFYASCEQSSLIGKIFWKNPSNQQKIITPIDISSAQLRSQLSRTCIHQDIRLSGFQNRTGVLTTGRLTALKISSIVPKQNCAYVRCQSEGDSQFSFWLRSCNIIRTFLSKISTLKTLFSIIFHKTYQRMKFLCLASALAMLAFQGESTLTATTRTAVPLTVRPPTVTTTRQASGLNYVQGFDNTVAGQGNAAIGKDNFIYGIDNYLKGIGNSAQGVSNIGIGAGNVLIGSQNVGLGYNNKLQGQLNYAEGQGNIGVGVGNIAQGYGNVLKGEYNVAQGVQNVGIGSQNFLVGEGNVAQGIRNVGIGLGNQVLGRDNYAQGIQNIVVGQDNAAWGKFNTVQGAENRVNGVANDVSGLGNIAVGVQNGVYGVDNRVYGYQNTVEGVRNDVIGAGNAVQGKLNYVQGQDNLVQGRQNEVYGAGNVVVSADINKINQFANVGNIRHGY